MATKKAAKTQTGRKAFGYGDEEFDVDADLGDPEGLASAIEQFVDAVDALISGDPS